MPIVILFISWLVIIAAGAYGWVSNILIVLETMGGAITGEFILRAIGIFAVPLGVVMGYI